MYELLKNWDTRLLIFFNSKHTPWLDECMYLITSDYFWIPLYVVIIGFLIKTFGKVGYAYTLLIILCVAASDQSSNWIKHSVKRLRPSHEPTLMVHTVHEYSGGLYGFVSSHAANTFCVFVLVSVLAGQNRPWLRYGLFIWAATVSYSRIYLGVHYPADVFLGACLGAFWGMVGSIVANKYFSRLKTKPVALRNQE